MKNKGNSNLNIKRLPLIHVKVKIEQGQGLRLGLGLKVRCKGEDQLKNTKLIKQIVAIPTPRKYVRAKIIDQIYAMRY